MWLFSVVGGLLLAEVNLNTLMDFGTMGCSMRGMADRTIGSVGSSVVSTSFIFLHCAMLVACEHYPKCIHQPSLVLMRTMAPGSLAYALTC